MIFDVSDAHKIRCPKAANFKASLEMNMVYAHCIGDHCAYWRWIRLGADETQGYCGGASIPIAIPPPGT